MKIEHSSVVSIHNTEDAKSFLKILTPASHDDQTREILAIYTNQKSWGAEMPSDMKHPHQDVIVALGTPEQGETIADALEVGEKDDWYPASLVHWNAYRKVHNNALHQTAIMGTICCDDDYHEWVFTIAHRKILGITHEYELSAKPLRMLRLKTLPVLLVKIPRKKK